MDYVILDSAGNALASFYDEMTARATLHAIAAVEPEAAEHVVLLAYGDDGVPVRRQQQELPIAAGGRRAERRAKRVRTGRGLQAPVAVEQRLVIPVMRWAVQAGQAPGISAAQR